MPQFDFMAPVRDWAVVVDLMGESWTIPALPAADWAEVILANQSDRLLDLIPDSEVLMDALLDGDLLWFEMETAYHDAIAAVGGARWWEVQNLMALALNWDNVGGELLVRQIRLDETSVARVCVLVWHLITHGREEMDVNKMRMLIEKPPAGTDYDAILDEAANAAALESIPSD